MNHIKELNDWVIEQRRYLHQHPELSHKEYKTRIYIEQLLNKMGIETYSLTGKDVIGIIKGEKEGKTIAIRADMDALPIQEETGLEFASTNTNIMHACGHDGHMAILLGIAYTLSNKTADIAGTILLVFQHAEEELPGGANELVVANLLEGVEAIFGYHLWQPLPSGLIGVREGPTMAGADKFKITIKGKGGHGSTPQDTIDPTLVISTIIMQLHTIVSRSLAPSEEAVVSIGELHSGSNYNIIPDTAFASGTVRYFNPETSPEIEKRIYDIVDGICKAHGATYVLDYQHGDPPLFNNPELTAFMEKHAQQQFGADSVKRIDGIMGSEDFAQYSTKIPSTYLFIGVGKEGSPYGHHHPKFDIDEDMLAVGVDLFTKSMLEYMKEDDK